MDQVQIQKFYNSLRKSIKVVIFNSQKKKKSYHVNKLFLMKSDWRQEKDTLCQIATTSSFREGKEEGKLSTSFFPYMWPCFAPSSTQNSKPTTIIIMDCAEYWRNSLRQQGQFPIDFQDETNRYGKAAAALVVTLLTTEQTLFVLTSFLLMPWYYSQLCLSVSCLSVENC